MTATPVVPADASLSTSLEDYLEAIYLLLRDQSYTRVRDIAKARGVRTGSVVPALKRLRDSGLIEYRQREYVNLTAEGMQAARRVYARHKVLSKFFGDVLGMSAEVADKDACAMEHGLSNEGLDRLVRFLEFLQVCPQGQSDFLSVFHRCSLSQDGAPGCPAHCTAADPNSDDCAAVEAPRASVRELPTMSVNDLKAGQSAVVSHVNARGSIRQRLLDMGILPSASLEVIRMAPGGDPVWVRLDGTQLALRQAEAKAVLVNLD